MHSLEVIRAMNERAKANYAKAMRPETLTRRANGPDRFPTAAELTTDRKPTGHGDPLTAAIDASVERDPDLDPFNMGHVLGILEDAWTLGDFTRWEGGEETETKMYNILKAHGIVS